MEYLTKIVDLALLGLIGYQTIQIARLEVKIKKIEEK